jgi:hypothetical protein
MNNRMIATWQDSPEKLLFSSPLMFLKFVLLTEENNYPAHEKPLEELVAHLPKLLLPIKLDTLIFLPTSLLLHSGQEIFLSSPVKTSFSNSFLH